MGVRSATIDSTNLDEWTEIEVSLAAGATSGRPVGQNVAPLSISVTAAQLAQYVSFSVAPAVWATPLQYVLSTHGLYHLDDTSTAACPYEPADPDGDRRQELTGDHQAAETAWATAAAVPWRIKLRRKISDPGRSRSKLSKTAARRCRLRCHL